MIQVLDENLSQTLSVGNSGVMSFDSSPMFATPWLSARSGFQKHYGQEIPEQGYSYLNEININFLGDQIARGSVFADLVSFFWQILEKISSGIYLTLLFTKINSRHFFLSKIISVFKKKELPCFFMAWNEINDRFEQVTMLRILKIKACTFLYYLVHSLSE